MKRKSRQSMTGRNRNLSMTFRVFWELRHNTETFYSKLFNYSPIINATYSENKIFIYQLMRWSIPKAEKKALLFALILYNSSCFGQFLRDTDACNFGIGTVLSLIQDSEEQNIASKTLCQWSSCTTYGELIAVTFVKYIRYLFWSKNFPIGTNHSSLIWILKTRKVHA